jgi:dihydroorotase
MPESILLRGGTVVHPGELELADILVLEGRIAALGTDLSAPAGCLVLDSSGCLIGPGFVDLHTHLREPGGEEAETVATGARAGALGGYTAVLAMPNTSPAIDCAAVVAQVLRLGEQSCIDVAVAGALTLSRAGERLAPMAEMAALGVRIFTDDGMGLQDAGLMRRAMEYAKGLGAIVADHCEDESLAGDGCMNESSLSAALGLEGRPGLAEEVMVARDLALAERVGCRLHLLHLSTARSAELVAQARARGVAVTAEVAPHHLTLTEELCASYDPRYKVHPPLRRRSDVEALRVALQMGVLDAVATDHAPHAPQTKDRPFAEAAPGMLGLQQAYALTAEALGGAQADPFKLFEVLSRTPAAIAGLRAQDRRPGGQGAHGGEVAVGEDANLVVVDPAARPVVRAEELASKARNTPYEGMTMTGAVRHTVARGVAVVIDGGASR